MGLLMLDVREKKLEAARSRIETKLTQRPDSAPLLLTAAHTYGAIGDRAAAERVLRRTIEVDPSNLQAYGLLGQLYLTERRTKEAIAEFERILARNPKSVPAHTLIGMLLEADNKRDEARRRYEQALSVDPRSPVPANNLAWMYAERGENLDLRSNWRKLPESDCRSRQPSPIRSDGFTTRKACLSRPWRR